MDALLDRLNTNRWRSMLLMPRREIFSFQAWNALNLWQESIGTAELGKQTSDLKSVLIAVQSPCTTGGWVSSNGLHSLRIREAGCDACQCVRRSLVGLLL
ncbi:hypothetical protein M514_09729 [Trichuris suis]|uniref:Uncharacterized protein n=1 Tax=Trichuris suis TaxID=68888 RepID=A0A085N521_9BILA|nr:hypothetical protein M513_09729 [Trichuris suis]KFD64567.1 hypothetical protein M514_09729 [Trichuris suis]